MEALQAFQEATRIDTNDFDSWFGVAFNATTPEDSIAAYKEVIRIRPDHSPAWGNLAENYSLVGDLKEALLASLEAVRLSPEYSEAWRRLGVSYRKLDQSEKSVEALREAIRLDAENPVAWYELGVTYRQSKEIPEAIESLQQAIEIVPRFYPAWEEIGLAYWDGRNHRKANEALREAVRLRPDNESAWANFVTSFLNLGEMDNGIEAAHQALEINSAWPHVLFALGRIHAHLNQRSKIIEIYRKLQGLDSDLADQFFSDLVVP